MATPIKPRRTKSNYPASREMRIKSVEPMQQGNVDHGDTPDWGDLPNSGPHEAGAGGEKPVHSKATTGFGKAVGKRPPGNADRTSHSAGKKHPQPQHTGSKTENDPIGHDPPGDDDADHSTGHGKAASLDTLTKLIFHPAGGMGHNTSAHSPQSSGGFKDSGSRTAPKIAKKEVTITRGRASDKVA